ncbi:MAG TPA: ATP-binding protein [Gaiellaceae bacterium]|nr:ATP-binding protein [Gaiellaceae bacterium]
MTVHAHVISVSRPGSLVRRVSRSVSRRTSSLSLSARLVIGSLILSILVITAFVILLGAMSSLRRSTNEQARSRNVTETTLGLERVVNDLESGVRSYALGNGDARFLSLWRTARAELPSAIAGVDAMNSVDPAQVHEAETLSAQIHAYITEYALPLIRIARISPAAARSKVAIGEGLRRIRAIRDGITHLLDVEDNEASAETDSAKVEATQAVRIGAGALGATIGLLVLFGIFLSRGFARSVRTVADGASQVAGGDLTTRLPEGGPAEIDTLTRSFNAMARSLEQGQRELELQNHELRERERQMAQLVGIVAHELRTPLSGILGYTGVLLNRRVSPADTKHYLEIVQEQGKRLESLFDAFLDGETVNAGRIELKDEPVDLRPLLVAEAHLLADESPAHRIEVEIEPPSLPVKGDANRLAQVFSNLLTNAIKYSPDGGLVEVRGSVEDSVVRVQVRDEGFGVPEEHQPRIFTKFFRGDMRESGIAGTGLGLAVSREIVEAHGGRIGFESTPGSGSTFWFELPLAD